MDRNTGFFACAFVGLVAYGCTPDLDALSTESQSTQGGGGASGAPVGGGGALTSHGGVPVSDGGAGSGQATAGSFSGLTGNGAQAGTTPVFAGGSSTLGGADATGGSTAVGGATAVGGDTTMGGATSSGGGGGATSGSGGQGGVQEVACAVAGKAFHFDSGSYVNVPRVIQDDFTLEAWIKTPDSLMNSYFWQGNPIAWADSTLSGANDFGISVLNSQFVFNVGSPDSSIFSTSVVTTNQWVHLAVTRVKASGVVKLYVNGVLEASNAANTATLDAVPVISIGNGPSQGNFLDGWMDELRLWQVVRTPQQISGTMHQLLTGTEPGLIAYYHFDQLVGLTVTDSSGHGNDGTAAGGDLAEALGPSNAPVCDPIQGASGSGGTGSSGASGSGGSSGTGGSSGSGGTADLAGAAGAQ